MPNWCQNNLRIVTKVNLKEFLVANPNGGYALKFEKAAPIGERDYDNAVKERGTKWDVNDNQYLDVVEEDGKYIIDAHFDTAWSPPIGYYEKLQAFLSRRDDDSIITAQYFEPGVGFLGERDNGEDYCIGFDDVIYVEDLDFLMVTASKDVYHLVRGFESNVAFRDEIPDFIDEVEDEEIKQKLFDLYKKYKQ